MTTVLITHHYSLVKMIKTDWDLGIVESRDTHDGAQNRRLPMGRTRWGRPPAVRRGSVNWLPADGALHESIWHDAAAGECSFQSLCCLGSPPGWWSRGTTVDVGWAWAVGDPGRDHGADLFG